MFWAKAILFFSIFATSNLHEILRSADWSYQGDTGPDHWPGICLTGKKQSPVDIKDTLNYMHGTPLKVVQTGRQGKVVWDKFWNGHTYGTNITDAQNSTYNLIGGALPDSYTFYSLHFHWGAEHTVDGKRYSGEAHLVHFNSKYSYEEALLKEDGLAVVGILLKEAEDNINDGFSEFVGNVILDSTPEGKIGQYSLNDILPEVLEPWVSYQGSLTTPDCTENVSWRVLLNPIRIRKGLVPTKGNYTHDLTGSYRPTQPLNGREIYLYSSASSLPPTLAWQILLGASSISAAIIQHFIHKTVIL